jgi:hypothetical protein
MCLYFSVIMAVSVCDVFRPRKFDKLLFALLHGWLRKVRMYVYICISDLFSAYC